MPFINAGYSQQFPDSEVEGTVRGGERLTLVALWKACLDHCRGAGSLPRRHADHQHGKIGRQGHDLAISLKSGKTQVHQCTSTKRVENE